MGHGMFLARWDASETARLKANKNSLSAAWVESCRAFQDKFFARWVKVVASKAECLNTDDNVLEASVGQFRQRSGQVMFFALWVRLVANEAERLKKDGKSWDGATNESRWRRGQWSVFARCVSVVASAADCLNNGNSIIAARTAPQRA